MNRKLFGIILLGLLASCTKTDILFQDTAASADPDIIYWDNYSVALATYKLDTFATTGDSVFVVGTHTDPFLGKTSALSFAEIAKPSGNPLKDQDVIFDSIVLVLAPNGNFYGDTTKPFKLNIFALTENIGTEAASAPIYYNPATVGYASIPLGSLNTFITPARGDSIQVRLADAFGADLFDHIKRGSYILESQATFRSYLKGICLATDSNYNQGVYHFTGKSGTGILRIYYTRKGLFSESKYMELAYEPSKQFNHIAYNYSGSLMDNFSPFRASVTESASMEQTALLSNYIPSYIKITFPDILDIKQTYPYVKLIRAVLELRVDRKKNAFPYVLPPGLVLYVSNQNNEISGALTIAAASGTVVQTGNLVNNTLEADGTLYSYEITDYLNTVIEEGRFSTKALLLSSYAGYNGAASRLVITNKKDDPDVRLKLYVLGL